MTNQISKTQSCCLCHFNLIWWLFLRSQQAIEAQSIMPPTRTLSRGDVEKTLAESDYVIEGEMRLGGQEHFYLETQACIAIPKGEDGEVELIASTQNPTATQVGSESI